MLSRATMHDDPLPKGDPDLHARAACLINPKSGIANDFLNHFNEVLLLVENLPLLLPEMVDELLTWRPQTYVEYFNRSKLPGGPVALARYESLPCEVREYLDFHVDRLNQLAVEIIAKISANRDAEGAIPPEKIADYCQSAGAEFRAEVDLLSTFVNCGYAAVQANNPTAAV